MAIELAGFEAATASDGAMPLVLVIDDQIVNVRLVVALLAKQGYATIFALNGEEGMALATSQSPDIVLLDMRMPGIDGFEVLRRLRHAPDTADLPIIFLTADNDRENLIRAFSAGVSDYVTKPFVARELLARVRTHVDLKRSRDALRRFAKSKQETAELVAHDMRNYLANIIFASDLQAASPTADANLLQLARSIRASADTALLFLEVFLEQQEGESGGKLVEPLPVGLLLAEAVEMMNSSARAKRIVLDLVPHDPLGVCGLRSGVVHVLQNLLSNAIKYAPPGSRVSVSAANTGRRGRMMVMDRGPGISQLDQRHLFQRFSRLSSEPTAGETSIGLGLALAKQQARAMGGDLWYEARGGGGSTFTLDLPLA